ncbi:hypothetical protein L227DRAFT_656019 [Lentinus tigrinus ALCF2SS1-6]|uniref:Uncharacterized protein n=1 Tax=Lentinus tigrinus ALCF2SS1-6 TaxID=1328759 RepID=A0A5C2S060_9APHY|nr:hypothetical protein L227DRAFT_656019 [Lentinus tigrinus ALCF2SS1-6]
MYTWSDTSQRGSIRGGRGGVRGGAVLTPGRRVWRDGGGPGYAGPGDTIRSLSTAPLRKSISSGGIEVAQSSLWGDQGQTGAAGRGGYPAGARGRGTLPRGRGGSSQARTSAPIPELYSTSSTGTFAHSTPSEDVPSQSPGRSVRGGYTTSATRGGRGEFASSGVYTGRGGSVVRGGYEGNDREGQHGRGRGRGGEYERGRGRGRGHGRGGSHASAYEEQEQTRWSNTTTSNSTDPWADFPYSSGGAATSAATDLWAEAAARDNDSEQSAPSRGSSRGRGGGRGRGGAWTEHFSHGGGGGRGDWTPRGGRGGRGDFVGYRGRGGRGSFQGQVARRSPPNPEVELPPPRDIMSDLLFPAIAQLTAPEGVSLEEPITIEDFKTISSYTWSQEKNPTIIVPGAPRQWLDRPLPIQVPFDRGVRIFHEDAFRMGAESTLLPLFHAVDALAADSIPPDAVNESAIDWTTVDFVTDRNNLRKLVRWIRDGPYPAVSPSNALSPSGADTPVSSEASPTETVSITSTFSDLATWDQRKDFRIDMQLGGTSTVLMHRWAAFAREWVEPPKAGCRLNFERENTAAVPGCEESGGHYRIVQYNIGGLNLVVRFEVDAFEDPNAEKVQFESPVSPRATSLWEDTPSGAEGEPADTTENTTSARQSFTQKNDVDLWDGPVSNASDWGFSEPSPASAGVGNSSALGGPAPATSSAAKKKAEESSAWEIKTDASAWGVEDPASWGAEAANDDAAAWGSVDDSSTAGGEETMDDEAAWSAGKTEDISAWTAEVETSTTRKTDESSWGPSTAAEFDSTFALLPAADLKVVRTGTLLPQPNILELATRSVHYLNRQSNDDTFLQLFLTQTPTHLVAVHQRGNFERVIRQELASDEFMRVAESDDIRRALAQFVELLRDIQSLVKEHAKNGGVSLVCEKGKLEMFRLVGQEGLVRQEELARFDHDA